MGNCMLFCKKCQRYRGCFEREGMWICCGCKKEVKKEEKSK